MKSEDAFIRDQVELALTNAGFLRNSGIKIEAINGEVLVMGIVDVLADKWAIGEVANRVPGVATVDNSLTVAIDRLMEDNEMAEIIQERLAADTNSVIHGVTATVKNGAAYLEGSVNTLAEVGAAKVIAARVQGIKEVISYLTLGEGAERTDDASVTNAVEVALSRSIEVSVRDINTITRGGKVVLTGTVDTWDQRGIAEQIVTRTPGVKSIDNRLLARNGGNENF